MKRFLLRSLALLIFTLLPAFGLSFPVDALAPAIKNQFNIGVFYYQNNNCIQQSDSAPSGPVYLIGDSVAAGAQAELEQTLGAKVNALQSRRLSEGSSPEDGITVMAADSANWTDTGVIIIELGTNGGLDAERIDKMINTIKQTNPSAKIYWVNVGANNSQRQNPIDTEALNATLQQNSLGGQKYQVIDWKTVVDENPSIISDLGVHINSPEGKLAFVETIASTLKEGSGQVLAGNSAGCVCGEEGLVGSDNAEKVYNFLVGKGLSPEQAAGVMGNFNQESGGFEPRRAQGGALLDDIIIDGKTGYGIAQWTSIGRQQNLKQFSIDKGKPVSSLELQLEFAYYESTEGTLAGAWDQLKQTTDVRSATLTWHELYERSADGPAGLEERVRDAEGFLALYGSSGGAPSSNTVACSGGQLVGDLSLPVDKSWYDQNPNWFSKPHHTYPASDIPVPTGTPIYSVTAGTIVSVSTGGNCGNGVTIDAGNNIVITYCHGLDAGAIPGAQANNQVGPGQLIMHSNNTGRSSGPHLHVQIKVNNQLVCPQPLFQGIVAGSPPDISTLPASGCSY